MADLKKFRLITVERLYPPGKMRNIGAQQALGKILAFIDDDCIPPPQWLSSLEKRLQSDENTGAVGCRVVSGEQTFMNRCADHCLFSAYQYRQNSHMALGSAALLVRREAFEDAEGFDENLLASEDWDFSMRLLRHGCTCFFIADVEVLHYHGRGTLLSILKGAYLSGYFSGVTVQRRHYSALSWLAKLSVSMGTPTLYWLLIIPYAAALTLLHAVESGRNETKVLLFLPLIFFSRCVYHIGVWARLLRDRNKSEEGMS
jgi:cellulose synthase/poly-beta-1,6-N-acetylglucosamine synthase-like glycosyltransferase